MVTNFLTFLNFKQFYENALFIINDNVFKIYRFGKELTNVTETNPKTTFFLFSIKSKKNISAIFFSIFGSDFLKLAALCMDRLLSHTWWNQWRYRSEYLSMYLLKFLNINSTPVYNGKNGALPPNFHENFGLSLSYPSIEKYVFLMCTSCF